MDTQPIQLIKRLAAVRATIRRRLLAYGLFVVAAGGVAAFLTIVLLDWLLWFPSAARVVVAAMFFAGFVVATWHWIVRPLGARVGIDEVAARLEDRFRPLRDRLTSSLSFLEGRDAGSETMMRRVITATERLVAETPLESALSLRPLVRGGCLLAFSIVTLAFMRWTSPEFLSTGLYRYIYPSGDIEWPRTVSILPLTGHEKVALGESVTVRMRVQRGFSPTLRGVVHLREPDGAMTRLAMRHDGDGVYSAVIDTVTRDLDYWFVAGDADTVLTPATIHAVRRPEVIEATAAIEPPPYAGDAAVRVQDLGDGPVHATIGGFVQVSIRTSKPVVLSTASELDKPVGLQTEGETTIPLVAEGEDATKLVARFEITEDVNFRIRLRDIDGFENRGATHYSIRAIADAPPTATVIEPTSVAELTPNGSLQLRVRAADDFGIESVELEHETLGAGAGQPIWLTDRLAITRDDNGVEGVGTYLWRVEPLALTPGDIVVYRLAATDNRPAIDGIRQVGRSSPMRIKIISAAEFDARVRSDIALLETRIRQVLLDETEILDRTEAMIRPEQDQVALDKAERDAAGMLAERQTRLLRRLRDLAGRFDDTRRRMELNRAGKDEDRTRIAALGQGLRDAAMGPMSSASNALAQVRETPQADVQQDGLAVASRSETEAVEQLQALMHALSQWGSFQAVVTKAEDLIDRQNRLRDETSELTKTMLGKPVESLTDEESSRLKRTTREQEQLGTDARQLVRQMERLATTLKTKDPSGAEAVDDAARAARANELERHLRDAAEAIQQNRTAAATLAQKAAGNAMRKMTAALRQRETRQLEELRKRIEEAAEQVAALIEQQKDIRAATQEAGLIGATSDRLGDIEQEQHGLRRNTKAISNELAAHQRAAEAARLVRQAASPMTLAEQHLRESQPQTAMADQDDAVELLTDALAELEELADAAANEAVRRSLAEIREALGAIRTAQTGINEGIGRVREAVTAAGHLGRSEARAASKLARRQLDARALLEEQRPEVERVVVYQWALERVARWMDGAKSHLIQRNIDDELVSITDRIVHELDTLIDAIVQTEALPSDTQFVESDSGGGSADSAASGRTTVPTVAELFVLKSLQVDVNRRTLALHDVLDANRATERQLREVQALGDDEAEIHRLTDRLVERARQP